MTANRITLFLIAVIDGRRDAGDLIGAPGLTQAEAREALLAVETQQLAIGALRTVCDHPKNPESITHAKSVLALVDAQMKRIAPAALQDPAPIECGVHKCRYPVECAALNRCAHPPAPQPAAGDDASDLV